MLGFHLFKDVLPINEGKLYRGSEIFVTKVEMLVNSSLFPFLQVGNFPERDPFEDNEI